MRADCSAVNGIAFDNHAVIIFFQNTSQLLKFATCGVYSVCFLQSSMMNPCDFSIAASTGSENSYCKQQIRSIGKVNFRYRLEVSIRFYYQVVIENGYINTHVLQDVDD